MTLNQSNTETIQMETKKSNDDADPVKHYYNWIFNYKTDHINEIIIIIMKKYITCHHIYVWAEVYVWNNLKRDTNQNMLNFTLRWKEWNMYNV